MEVLETTDFQTWPENIIGRDDKDRPIPHSCVLCAEDAVYYDPKTAEWFCVAHWCARFTENPL